MRQILFCLCLLPLAGCAQKAPIPEAARPESFAAVTLGTGGGKCPRRACHAGETARAGFTAAFAAR